MPKHNEKIRKFLEKNLGKNSRRTVPFAFFRHQIAKKLFHIPKEKSSVTYLNIQVQHLLSYQFVYSYLLT